MLFSFKKELVINYFYYSLGFIIPGVLSFLFIPFVMRSYGAGVYAQYSLIFNTLSTVSIFCYGWVGQSFIRFYSKEEAGLLGTVSKFLWKSLLAGSFFFSILVFLITNISFENFLLLIPSFFLAGYYSFFLLTCQAKQDAKRVAISEALRTMIIIGLPLFCYLFFSDEYALKVLLISLFISYLIPLMTVLKKDSGASYFFFNREEGEVFSVMEKKIKSYGIPVALFLSLSLALSVNDRFIIAKFLGYKDSGNYAALYDILNKGVAFSCSPVVMTFYPHIVKEYNAKNEQGAYISLAKAILMELCIFLSGFIILYFWGDVLLAFIFKNSVPPGFRQFLSIVYTAVFVWQIAMLVHKPLELRMKTKHLAIGVSIALIVNLVLNWVFISKYKDVSIAAYTTLGSSLLYIFYVAFFSLKRNV